MATPSVTIGTIDDNPSVTDWAQHIQDAHDTLPVTGSGDRAGTVYLTDFYPINKQINLDSRVFLQGDRSYHITHHSGPGFEVDPGESFTGDYLVQWDVAGGGDRNTSLTGGQHFYTINLTGGWQIVGTPQWSYNHEADSENAWTVPLAVGVAKTSIFGGRPWKMNVQYWYFVESPDSFGPRHQVRFTVGPVVGLPW